MLLKMMMICKNHQMSLLHSYLIMPLLPERSFCVVDKGRKGKKQERGNKHFIFSLPLINFTHHLVCRSNKSKISPQINLLDSPVITKRSKSTKNCFESRFLLEQMSFVAQGSVYGIQLYILLAFLPLSPVILYCIPVAAASSILVVMLYLPICVMQVSRDVQIHSISHAY